MPKSATSKKYNTLSEDEYTSIYSERNDNPRPRNPYAHSERELNMPRGSDTVLVASPRTFADLKTGEQFFWGVSVSRKHAKDVMVKVGHNSVLNKSLSDAGSWLDDENMYVRTLQSLGRSPLDPVEPIVKPVKTPPAMPRTESQCLAADLIEGRSSEHLKKFQFKKKGAGEDKEKSEKLGTKKVGASKEGGMAKAATGTGKMQMGPSEDHENDYEMGKKKTDSGPREDKEPKKGDSPKGMGGSSTECSGVSEDAHNVVNRMLDSEEE